MVHKFCWMKFAFVSGLCLFFMLSRSYSMEEPVKEGFGLQQKSVNHSRLEFATVLARFVTILGASLKETPSKNWDLAANASRAFNSFAGNYFYDEKAGESRNVKQQTISPALEVAQLSYIGNIVLAFVNEKTPELKKRTHANRAVLVTLALVESCAMLCSCLSKERDNAAWLSDVAAVTSVIHSIKATQDRNSKLVGVTALILVIDRLIRKYSIVVTRKLVEKHA